MHQVMNYICATTGHLKEGESCKVFKILSPRPRWPSIQCAGVQAVHEGTPPRGARKPRCRACLVVLVGCDGTRAFACVYSSEAGEWGDLISAACPSVYALNTPSALIGGSLYWLLGGSTRGILELDLDRRRLALVPMPANISSLDYLRHWVMPGEGGDLGFLCLSGCSVAELWTRKRDRWDAAQWVLRRTIDLAKLLSLSSSEDGFPPMIFGFAEEDRVSFLATHKGICMVQLESMQFKRSFDISKLDIYHPFASVYTAGLGTGGGQDGPEPVHNT